MDLIKFVKQPIGTPDDWDRPYYRTLERGDLRPISIYDESVTTMPLVDTKKVDYERIVMREANGTYHNFYVNFEEAALAMPMLKTIVENETKELKTLCNNLEIETLSLKGKLKRYEKLWFVKLYNWFKYGKNK